MLYFSYGSNMSSKRLLARLPTTRFLSTGMLSNHRLVFHKRSVDGSAKCDAWHSQNSEDAVYGVIFRIDAIEKPILDGIEGTGYSQKRVTLRLNDGNSLEAFTYFAIDIEMQIKPYSWYLQHVIRGAAEHDLPDHYIDKIRTIHSVEDPDRTRHKQELSIY